MKKKWKNDVSKVRRDIQKLLLIMKLTALLTLVLSLSVSAGTYSQNTKLNISLEGATIEQVLLEIENNSRFIFIYENGTIDKSIKRTISVKDQTIDKVLSQLFEGTDVNFTFDDRQISLYKKNSPIVPGSNNLLSVDQQKTISGKVTDSSGSPLPGVTVVLKGTTRGIITDTNGTYSLNDVPADAVLVFSFVGMATQEIPTNGKTIINIEMAEEAIGLEEVVAVGYGTMKKSDLTGSVASVNSNDIVSSRSGTIEQALSGKLAGVVINNVDNSPGAGLNIEIRGMNSINASSAPLYVIDGFPVEGSFGSGSQLESVTQSPLSGLDPNNIESIDVLKDASATAIYGARGANGVVIITTKEGKEGKTKVSFNANFGMESMINKYNPLDGVGYAKFQHEVYFPYDKRTEEPEPDGAYYQWWNYETYADSTNTNWLDEVTRIGYSQDYNISMSGGNKKGNYYASVGYYNTKGIVKETDYSRFNFNFKANGSPTDWMKLEFNSNISTSENNGTVTVNSLGNAQFSSTLLQATNFSPLKSPDYAGLEENGDYFIGSPLISLRDVYMLREHLNFRVNGSISLIPVKDVVIKSTLGLNKSNDGYKYYASSNTAWGSNYNGWARLRNSDRTSWLNENTTTINKKYGKHKINFLAGFTVQSNNYFESGMESSNFAIETLGYNNMSVGEDYLMPETYGEKYLLLSYLGRINYDFNNRLLITSTIRADGSSKFAENNKWGYFPSFALAWRAGEEPFIKNLGLFDNLKFRLGWGQTGNPNISPYQSLTNYSITKYPSGESLSTGIYAQNAGNVNLKWETSEQANIGMDVSLFDNRLSFSIDGYIKKTKDLLINGDIAPSTGFSTYLYNSGGVENKGLEIAVTSLIVDRKLKWDANLNISFNRNKVNDLGELTTSDYILVPGSSSYNSVILEEDSPIGLWYGYKTDGLWQQNEFTWNGTSYVLKADENGNLPAAAADAKPGYWKYKDISGADGVPDGKIDSYDKTVIGISQPKFTGGMNNHLEYKNFDLNVFLEWSYGRDVYNCNNRFFIEPSASILNAIDVDYWLPIQYAVDENGLETSTVLDPGNPDGKYPGPGLGNPWGDMHDGYMEDGSYLRIKNISLGYTLKKTIVSSLNISALSVHASVQNLYTLTKYSGYDPNVNGSNLRGLRPGYDFGSYPLARTFTFSISADF